MVDRRLRNLSYLLVLIGLGCAIYLTYTKYAHNGVCGVSGGCTVVQTSTWSELFGIPVSVLGIVGYISFFGLLTAPWLLTTRYSRLLRFLVGRRSEAQANENVRLLLVIATGVGFLFSMFLMYRAYITLDAFCPFCTTSAVMMTLLFLISTYRFVRGPGLAPGAFSEPLDLDESVEDDAVGVADPVEPSRTSGPAS